MNLNFLLKPAAVGAGLLGAEKIGALVTNAVAGGGANTPMQDKLARYGVPGLMLAVGVGLGVMRSPIAKTIGLGVGAGALVHAAAGVLGSNVDVNLTSY